MNRTKIIKIGLSVLTVLLLLSTVLCFSAFAAGTEATTQAATEAKQEGSNGLGLLAAGIVTGLAGIGGGIAVAAGAPAAIAATAENPKSFGKSIIFVALGESIALYGVVISILILNKI